MQNPKFINADTENIVSKLAQDETGKRQYYRPVYSLHKWWARRPGALFRAIILSATTQTNKLFTTTNGSVSTDSEYFKDHNLEHTIILDPFMGGGTTLVEANRLGAKVIGCDLNPVSFWIVRETLKPIDVKKLDYYFQQLEQTAGEKIRSLYRTRCVHCHTQAETLYVFWVRYIHCRHCDKPVHLFKRTFLNHGLSRNKPPSRANPATVFCPRCFALNDWYGKENSLCYVCGHTFDPRIETYDQGFYTCPECQKSKISLIQTLGTGQKLHEKLVAVEYWCPRCRDRFYKSPDEEDLATIAKIEDTVANSQGEFIFPKQQILEGASSVRWRRHNYRSYYEVFHVRQLLAFQYLIEAIRGIPEEEYRNAFITIFSNSLEYNNMMTPYNYPHRKLHHLFNYHAMPLTTTPVENVVWGVGEEGAGTFTNCYQRYVRAKKYCRRPYDKFKNSQGVIQTLWAKHETIAANFVSSFELLKTTPRGTLLLCRDSSHLSEIPDESVDFVITAPPYFGSIHYSELSNFFYVWLRSLVEHQYFITEHVPTAQEAIVNDGMNKSEQEYQDLLASVFKECQRVLKCQGKLIFTFHHTKWRAWWTVLSAIKASGFRVADYFPVMSEYKVNPHIRNKQALDMDLVLVCQKNEISSETFSRSPADILQRAVHDVPLESQKKHDSTLFLHFMGELLKTASSNQDEEHVSYHWFSEALTHFDDFLTTLDRTEKEHYYETPKPVQLTMFESNALE
jgi:putative DNA methylase